ncbi:acyltransferase family protein [Pelagicoccus mobilis]|uniref:Acyltransferase n=1 Tax=Pelagicoccus mobilis TaxID=415221 RepID=A0A934RVE5_9BACT|nr:acyltransferase [Pelagicoccus mobilis]MBK1878410.1 acyltransferase [Pelagicoccus mobilis]
MGELNRERLDVVQVWRGLAASLIVIVHVFLRLDYVSTSSEREFLIGNWVNLFFCEMGVDAFFVISGFIMVYISDQGTSQSGFLLKRALRIYPPYWIYSGMMIAVLFFVVPNDRRLGFDFVDLTRALFLIPTINDVTKNIFPLFLSQGWTLIYELFFYLVFFLFLKVGSVARTVLTSVVLVVFHLIAIKTGLFDGAVKWLFSDSVMLEFIIGMLLGLFYTKTRFSIRKGVAWLLAGIGVVWFIYFQINEYQGWGVRIVSYCIPLSLLFAATVFCEELKAIQFPKALLWLGDASYSIYLTHTIVIFGFARLNRKNGVFADVSLDVQFVLILLTALAVGVLLYQFVEKQTNRLSRVLIKKVVR